MPTDEKKLSAAFDHIMRIKEGTYPAVVGRDHDFRIVERPWAEMPDPSKLAILQDAVNWEGVSNRDMAHILLSEIDPGKISDKQRNALINMAVEGEPQAQEKGGRGTMIHQNQPCDPAVHSLATTIARRCVWIIQACLREEERGDAAREFYQVIRGELEKKPGREPEV